MKKYLLFITIAIVAFLTGCQSTPTKLIAATSATVDGAMKAWAIYVVDGHATEAQRVRVRELQARYYLAEDSMLVAYSVYSHTGVVEDWQEAAKLLIESEAALVNFIASITGKATP